ncbi:hypothetical protein B0T10DRAFT_162477 [Thelonectria olida]|uniref:Uncharacterized protein n=1 Tax=Thelonectria olida TaxID=1576542 RepID=A0A9P9ARG2_9HYPO|nr:hypothetical protein B0T10DRAFT_162477 [Thelonectria olida]
MSIHWWALRIIQSFEDKIVTSILKQPGFHRAVGKIHRKIDEVQNGRNPNEPLAPGEATAEPNPDGRRALFAKHFYDELKNQFQGKPTELPPDRPPKK